MTREQLAAKLASNPAFAKRNPHLVGLPTANKKSTQGHALVGAVPRKEKSRPSIAKSSGHSRRSRARITFRIFAVRPADWDGYHIKELQDVCVKSGLLDGDEWDILEGQVISEKAYAKDAERTEITIEPL